MSDGVADIRAALERTRAAGTARITYQLDIAWKLPEFPTPQRSAIHQAAIDAGKTAGKAVGKALWRLATRRQNPAHHRGEGFVDLAGWRSMVDQGSFAQLQIGHEEWHGRSGRALATLPSVAPRTSTPLWLIGLVAGVNSADDHGAVESDGHAWRHLSATASLADAAESQPGPMASPNQDRYDDLLALPLEVWVDDTHLRRIRFVDDSRTTTVTLSDFGVAVDDLDWTRLPTFLSPQEEASHRRRQAS